MSPKRRQRKFKKMLRRLPRWAPWLCLALLVATVAGFAWWWTPPAGLDAWRSGSPPGSWAVRDAQVAVWAEAGVSRQVAFDYRPLEAIPIDVQLAALAGEDINFFGHQGIDFTAVREAVDEWRAGDRLRGASTVTQQLAKNVFLSNQRSWLRKLREARLARHLEAELGKRRILELYLNVIEFGEGVFGVEAAARRYYQRGVERLSADQAAGLAATIPAPHVSNPATATRAWQNRKAIIAERMQKAGWLRDLLARQQ